MNLERGCNYCANLQAGINNFRCAKNPYWDIRSAGACFVKTTNNVGVGFIIENCPDFNEIERSSNEKHTE